MSVSTKEYWSVGTPSGGTYILDQYCHAVTTSAAGRFLPSFRGQNIQVAYVPGQIYRPKYPDSRVISLTMFVAGIDPATDQPATYDQHLAWSNNLRALQSIFYQPQTQFPLTRRWYYSLPVNTGIPTGVPTMVEATAMAECAGPMQPTMFGQSQASFTIDLLLADPYFYGPQVSVAVPYNSATSVYNTGDDVAAYFNNTVTLYGPLQYPRVTNSTTGPPTWVQLNTVIASGDSVLLDIANYTAYRASDGANLSGSITHSGTFRWMSYNPGVNSVTLTSASTGDSGTAALAYVPAYA